MSRDRYLIWIQFFGGQPLIRGTGSRLDADRMYEAAITLDADVVELYQSDGPPIQSYRREG